MNTKQIIDGIRKLLGQSDGKNERELMEALVSESDGWRMRLQELEEEGTDD